MTSSLTKNIWGWDKSKALLLKSGPFMNGPFLIPPPCDFHDPLSTYVWAVWPLSYFATVHAEITTWLKALTAQKTYGPRVLHKADFGGSENGGFLA